MLGLERYKAGEWSAPRVPHIDMEDEEIQFAKMMNASSSELPILSEITATEAEEEKLAESFQAVLDNLTEHCNHQVGKEIEYSHVTPSSSVPASNSFPPCAPASDSSPTCAPAGGSTPTCAPASRSTRTWSQAVAEPDTDGTQVDTRAEGPGLKYTYKVKSEQHWGSVQTVAWFGEYCS